MEIAIVLMISGGVIAALWGIAGNSSETQKENDAVSELQMVSRGIFNFMQGRTFNNVLNPAGCTAVSTVYPKSIASAMVAAQAIPASYKNTNCMVNNPWDTGAADAWIGAGVPVADANRGLEVYAMAARSLRISYYNVSQEGCIALLTQGTACQSNQIECPVAVWTNAAAIGCSSTLGTCAGAMNVGTGWQVLTPTRVATLCTANSYVKGVGNNSVEFDYTW